MNFSATFLVIRIRSVAASTCTPWRYFPGWNVWGTPKGMPRQKTCGVFFLQASSIFARTCML